MALAVKGGDVLMEQTKAGSLWMDRAEDVAYLKAPTSATFLHHAVSVLLWPLELCLSDGAILRPDPGPCLPD